VPQTLGARYVRWLCLFLVSLRAVCATIPHDTHRACQPSHAHVPTRAAHGARRVGVSSLGRDQVAARAGASGEMWRLGCGTEWAVCGGLGHDSAGGVLGDDEVVLGRPQPLQSGAEGSRGVAEGLRCHLQAEARVGARAGVVSHVCRCVHAEMRALCSAQVSLFHHTPTWVERQFHRVCVRSSGPSHLSCSGRAAAGLHDELGGDLALWIAGRGACSGLLLLPAHRNSVAAMRVRLWLRCRAASVRSAAFRMRDTAVGQGGACRYMMVTVHFLMHS